MSHIWRKAREGDERETVLICKATQFREIAGAITELIARMEADWVAQGRPKEEAIFIDVNATIGHMMFLWDKKGGGAFSFSDDWPPYYLELRELWRESEDHRDGAGHFDRRTRRAIYVAVKDMLIAAERVGHAEPYEVYHLFEGATSRLQRVLV